MADSFEGNGEYTNYGDGASDFKRKAEPKKDHNDDELDDGEEEDRDKIMGPDNGKTNEYLKELIGERVNMDRKYPIADKLLELEIQKVKESAKMPPKDNRYVDIYREKQIKVSVKVLVPIKEHPKFNFVGKLLGPKGNSMKRLQEETMCKMAVFGRGSMKDRKREEDLRASLEPKYAHLNDDLHVEISALAPPAEAHARVAFALAEVRKYLVPDSNDVIRREQMRELISDGSLPPEAEEQLRGPPSTYMKRPSSGGGPMDSSYGHHSHRHRRDSRSPSRTVMPAKQKVMSILDRARTAMEESYHSYDDASCYEPSGGYEMSSHRYGNHHPQHHHHHHHSHHEVPGAAPPPPPSINRSRYVDYEPASSEYSRGDYYRGHNSSPPPYVKSSASSSSASRGGGWKNSSHSSSSSSARRHDDVHHNSHSGGGGSHHHHHRSGEGRYRNSPYSRPGK